MANPRPHPPDDIDPLGEQILDALRGNSAVDGVILGGGFALRHYRDFRQTHDIDAWWGAGATEHGKTAIRDAVEQVAAKNGFDFRERAWGDTLSYEILAAGTAQKVFSFQISTRDVQIDEPLESSWSPLRIETLRDNVASKMNALVDRGAPRDFLDIYEIVSSELVSAEECWRLWRIKNPATPLSEARDKVLHKMEQIEARRPLASLVAERQALAMQRRAFFKGPFLRDGYKINDLGW